VLVSRLPRRGKKFSRIILYSKFRLARLRLHGVVVITFPLQSCESNLRKQLSGKGPGFDPQCDHIFGILNLLPSVTRTERFTNEFFRYN
jgi:hypothetical protein